MHSKWSQFRKVFKATFLSSLLIRGKPVKEENQSKQTYLIVPQHQIIKIKWAHFTKNLKIAFSNIKCYFSLRQETMDPRSPQLPILQEYGSIFYWTVTELNPKITLTKCDGLIETLTVRALLKLIQNLTPILIHDKANI